ncbi:Acyltransferase family protein [Rhodobacteraceae bacterium THAF1]|uniref:acyltransferase family protein n=1 Tax=Palleronia sp. THAF1 TaxID=2587842 RepID=UPI000F3F7BCA|nr:acyltransferase [Palleronia sp. THAF1]QFU10335.1 Acyltransferase family protein [Palleronia sp. THAF1]VDC31453.1 Acyltransferase family protein [Rhodobacteraceae bacterium THAF1]
MIDPQMSNGSGATTPAGHQKTQFNAAVHGLRGLAAMMVFFAHILNGLREHAYPEMTEFVARSEVFWNLGTYGVYLFFTISGFVILPSAMRYSAGEFAARRFWRIYPLFLFMTVIFIVLAGVTGQGDVSLDPYTIFVALTFMDLFTPTGQLTPNAWSLTFEVFFYALTCMVVVWTIKRPHWLGGSVAVALAVAFMLAFPVSVFFLMGMAARIGHDRGWLLPRSTAVPVELLLLLGLGLIASQGHFAYVWADFSSPIALATITLTGAYFYHAAAPGSLTGRIMTWRPLLYIGTVSYSLYLVHPYTYLAVRMTFQKLGFFTPDVFLSGVLFYAAVIVPTILVTHVIHRTVETWPYRAVFNRNVVKSAERYVAPGGSTRPISQPAP